MDTPFHEGERAVQARAGVGDVAERVAGFVRDHLPGQHRAFYAGLPFLVAGGRDADGCVWATVLEGAEGFVTSPDPISLEIAARPGPGDPLDGALDDGAPVGLLGIELATRRRNRINGRVRQRGRGLSVAVDQTFGNCPQYIHPRTLERAGTAPGPVARSDRLTQGQADRIRGADTFFVATGHPGGTGRSHGLDASHRGGPSGFVTVTTDGRSLRFPDYAGNDFFNTLGNLERDPRAGLLFVDFGTGGLLHLTGRIAIDWTDAPDSDARRHLDMDIEAVIDRPAALALRWGAPDAAMRRLRLVARMAETAEVTSFTFAAEDGAPLPDAVPGQHLPITLRPGGGPALERSYSLSGPPGTGRWRISVKRAPRGTASRLLHDRLAVGDAVDALPPSGAFGPTDPDAPLVLVSAGIGLTPMVAHLHAAAASGREAWFVHGARRAEEHAMAAEIRETVAAHPDLHARLALSAPDPGDTGHDWTGRLTAARILGTGDHGPLAEFLLCGPPAFVTTLERDLIDGGIAPARIHIEAF